MMLGAQIAVDDDGTAGLCGGGSGKWENHGRGSLIVETMHVKSSRGLGTGLFLYRKDACDITVRARRGETRVSGPHQSALRGGSPSPSSCFVMKRLSRNVRATCVSSH